MTNIERCKAYIDALRHEDDSDYLEHYGRKGMKWGVRRGPPYPIGSGSKNKNENRYANKDGSLTTAGKARLKKIYSIESRLNYDKKESERELSSITKHGIVKDSNGTDIIKKGSVLERVSNIRDESMDRAKYAYITKRDEQAYIKMMKEGYLGTKDVDNIFKYRLEAVDDLKVASGKNVCDRIIRKYGDKNLKKAYKEYLELDLRNNHFKTYGLTDTNPNSKLAKSIRSKLGEYKNDKWAGNYAKETINKVYSGLNKLLYSNTSIRSDIYKYYVKKGYDAIVDAEDYSGGFEYPVILLNPENSVTVKSVRRLKT